MIMQIKTELDSLVEGYLGLPGAVHIAGVLALHNPLPMVKLSLDHAVPDGLGHNELGVLGAVQSQLLRDVGEGYLAVGQGDGLHRGLDHVMMEPCDQGVGVVSVELGAEVLNDLVKPCHVPGLDSLGHLEIWVKSSLQLNR